METPISRAESCQVSTTEQKSLLNVFFWCQDSFMCFKINTFCEYWIFSLVFFFLFFFFRDSFTNLLKVMVPNATQCSHLFRTATMGSWKKEFPLVVADAADSCTFLVAEKLGRPLVTILTSTLGISNFVLSMFSGQACWTNISGK